MNGGLGRKDEFVQKHKVLDALATVPARGHECDISRGDYKSVTATNNLPACCKVLARSRALRAGDIRRTAVELPWERSDSIY